MAKAKTKRKGWGGARENSGPKRETLSVRQVKEMDNKAQAYAKQYGKTIDEILLEFIYGITQIPVEGEETLGLIERRVATKERIACIKLWKEYTSPKITEGGEADITGLQIYLPEHVDEGKVIPIDR